MLNRHLNENEKLKYLEALEKNDLSELSEEIKEHTKNCDECFSEIISLYRFSKSINKKDKKNFFQKNRFFLLKIAAIFIISLSTLFFFFYEKENIKTFAEVEHLEYVISHHSFRKKNYNNEKKFFPKNNQKFKKNSSINFKWDKKFSKKVFLIIIKNSEKEIFKKKMESNKYTLEKHNFETGLYYWKLETEEELIFLGKFKIQN
ncbi:MAG: hypothetical protein B6I24_04375 [Bacteroidetes bacterium 4572_128]|nr:MAG: hypothetical protein B6I24_04375 [Bacteroidetes bacterium 4572_128]